MPDIRQIPGSCEQWLSRAKADLALARTALPEGGVYEDLAFHAQQAAEKAIKAVYVKMEKRFAYTHDIAELLSGLDRLSVPLTEEVKEAADLSTYAWESRYPYVGDPVTKEEHQEAVRHAETVIAWAEIQIESVGSDNETPE